MARRRLTRRQAHHVQRIQQRRIARAKRRDSEAGEPLAANRLGPETLGRVVANFGASLLGSAANSYVSGETISLTGGDQR